MIPFTFFGKGSQLDERYRLHRYKSTSNAGVAGALGLAGYLLYRYYGHGEFHWELFWILLGMALVKVICLAWFRLRD